MTPLEFLNALWEYKPEDQYILIWTGADKRSRWFLQVAEAAAYAASVAGDVYSGVGLAGKDYGLYNRCPSDEITAIAGIGGDFDLLSDAHKNKALPQTIEQAVSIHPAEMKPTFTIATGNGIQSWWLLKEPYVFDSADDRTHVARLLSRWHTMLRVNAQKHGWAYERLADLARVLRIPGTRNCKDPRKPKDVVLYSETGNRLNMGDFADLVDYNEIPDPSAQEKAARDWRAQFADTPLTVNVNARIAQDLLDAWMDPANSDAKTAMTFRNTWERRRSELKDQSNSGYDMALIHFGLDAGLSEQQIVDLIVHHRAQNGCDQKRDAGYFRRSIAKAHAVREKDAPKPAIVMPAAPVAGEAASPSPVNGAPAPPVKGAPPPPADGPSPPLPAVSRSVLSPEEGEERAKLLLCQEISLLLGIEVVKMVCIHGKDPTFHMHTADGVVEFDKVAKLITFRLLEDAIAGQTLRIINRFKAKEWEAFRQKLLSACIVRETTDDEQFEGGARNDILDYLTETDFIPAIEGQRIQDKKKPMILDGKSTIASPDLAAYLDKTKGRKTSAKYAASMLNVVGARKTDRLRSSQYASQTRWALPLPMPDRAGFDPRAIKPTLYIGEPAGEPDQHGAIQ